MIDVGNGDGDGVGRGVAVGIDNPDGVGHGRRAAFGADERERGAGSILSVALVATMLAALVMLLPLAVVLGAKQRAAGAADSAALAAADTVVGIRAGSPCLVAESVAVANGASMTGCQVDGFVATVRVRVPAAGFPIVSSATAGPPDSGTD